jgi:hypothetical protein
MKILASAASTKSGLCAASIYDVKSGKLNEVAEPRPRTAQLRA